MDADMRAAERAGDTDRLDVLRRRAGLAPVAVHEVAARLVAAHRVAHPRSRLVGMVYYSRNGQIRRERSCAVCGRLVTSWSGKWPRPASSVSDERGHVDSCARAHAARVLEPGEVLS